MYDIRYLDINYYVYNGITSLSIIHIDIGLYNKVDCFSDGGIQGFYSHMKMPNRIKKSFALQNSSNC